MGETIILLPVIMNIREKNAIKIKRFNRKYEIGMATFQPVNSTIRFRNFSEICRFKQFCNKNVGFFALDQTHKIPSKGEYSESCKRYCPHQFYWLCYHFYQQSGICFPQLGTPEIYLPV